MSAPVAFLHSLAQALSSLALYPEGHASRERALDHVFEKLQDLLVDAPRPTFSFLGEEVIYADLPLREMRGWTWSARLAEIGIQRLRFDRTSTREELEEFIDLVLARLAVKAIDTSEARQMRPSGIRYGLGGDLDEVEVLAVGVLPRLVRGLDSELAAVVVDEPDAGDANRIVDARRVARRRADLVERPASGPQRQITKLGLLLLVSLPS